MNFILWFSNLKKISKYWFFPYTDRNLENRLWTWLDEDSAMRLKSTSPDCRPIYGSTTQWEQRLIQHSIPRVNMIRSLTVRPICLSWNTTDINRLKLGLWSMSHVILLSVRPSQNSLTEEILVGFKTKTTLPLPV